MRTNWLRFDLSLDVSTTESPGVKSNSVIQSAQTIWAHPSSIVLFIAPPFCLHKQHLILVYIAWYEVNWDFNCLSDWSTDSHKKEESINKKYNAYQYFERLGMRFPFFVVSMKTVAELQQLTLYFHCSSSVIVRRIIIRKRKRWTTNL